MVSAAFSAMLGTYAPEYQALSAHAAVFRDQFVPALGGASTAYAAAEAANAGPLQTLAQDLSGVINAPAELLGRPLIGNGTNGAPVGQWRQGRIRGDRPDRRSRR
ncbi:PE family protein [Mycobacterium sp.]|uniref:PE family protein n=1 Tax=Mycobacterium sp. TaxID=1785 RepID=UPI003C74CF99